MGVDTKEKRLSFLNFGLPWWSTLPETDGAIDSDDRLHLLHLYSGIAAEVVIVLPSLVAYPVRRGTSSDSSPVRRGIADSTSPVRRSPDN